MTDHVQLRDEEDFKAGDSGVIQDPIEFQPVINSGGFTTQQVGGVQFDDYNKIPWILFIIGCCCLFLGVITHHNGIIFTIIGFGILLYGYFGYKNHTNERTRKASTLCLWACIVGLILVIALIAIIGVPILLGIGIPFVLVVIAVIIIIVVMVSIPKENWNTDK